MNAFEFVKENGIERAKREVELIGTIAVITCDEVWLAELKCIVESFEIIKRDFGCIELAEYEYAVSDSYDDPYWIRVKQAIADVEALA